MSAAYCQMVGMLSTWGHRGEGPVTYIAVCECSMVITALWDMSALVKEGRRVLWLLDNSASLHALIKGTSGNIHLSRAEQQQRPQMGR